MVSKEEDIVGYKTESGIFCNECSESRHEKIKKVITKKDLTRLSFICDDCGNEVCGMTMNEFEPEEKER